MFVGIQVYAMFVNVIHDDIQGTGGILMWAYSMPTCIYMYIL